jgi:hypothetical protein
MPEYKGIEYLRNKLAVKRMRVLTRYKYYDMKNTARDLSGVMPEQFNWLCPVLSWCETAVDSVVDRIKFDRFANDIMGLNDIFKLNSQDIFVKSAVKAAVIVSCSFVYISQGQNGFPRLQAIDGGNATGILDPVTQMLTEGYAVLERDDMGNPSTEGYFTAEATWIYRAGEKSPTRYDNPAPFALLVPMVHRADPTRPFGRSRISRACMELTNSAIRTLRRSEVSAEFYSFPQKYVVGMSPAAQQLDKWKATISSLLQFDKDEDGDHPILGQFQQQSMTPYNEQLKTIASMFAGATCLTLDDLGFSTANPSTAEAIDAAHERLYSYIEATQSDFAVGFLNAGYLAACLRDNFSYDRSIISDTKVKYKPITRINISNLNQLGDAANKLQQAFPGYFDEEKLYDCTGI